jgi:hypothetical protein
MEKLSNFWESTKDFFKRSETVFYARLQTIIGFVLAVLGTIDWSQIQTWDFTTPRQTAWLGIGLVVNGLVTEVLRRRNMNA